MPGGVQKGSDCSGAKAECAGGGGFVVIPDGAGEGSKKYEGRRTKHEINASSECCFHTAGLFQLSSFILHPPRVGEG